MEFDFDKVYKFLVCLSVEFALIVVLFLVVVLMIV